MKSMIVCFILALIFTCCVNGVAYPPQPVRVGISDVHAAGRMGVKREEGMYPEFYMTDQNRQSGLVTGIYDNSKSYQADFPNIGAGNN